MINLQKEWDIYMELLNMFIARDGQGRIDEDDEPDLLLDFVEQNFDVMVETASELAEIFSHPDLLPEWFLRLRQTPFESIWNKGVA